MVEKRTIANVVTACVWIGSLIFLIWLCVVTFQRLQRTSVVTTSFSNPEAITYPGLFVCPSSLTVSKASFGDNITISSMASAEFVPFKPYDADATERGYSVCPRTVAFPTPDGKMVQCVDFPPHPVYSLAMTNNNPITCPDVNPQAFWYKANTNVPDPQVAVWTATSLGNGMYIGFNSVGILNEPYMVLLYSSKTRLQPPTNFQEYAQIFPLTNFFLAHLPLMSYSAVNIDKLITDNWPVDSDCSYEAFLSAVDQFSINSEPASTDRVATILLGFDILEEVTTCHSPVVSGTDVLGIVGGGIALVLAVTIGFQLLVRKLLGGPHSEDTNVQSSSYRPLAGDNL